MCEQVKLGMEVPESEHRKNPGCSSHGPPGWAGFPAAAAAQGKGLWSQGLQNMQHFMCNFSSSLAAFSAHRGYCVQTKVWGLQVLRKSWKTSNLQQLDVGAHTENMPLLLGCAMDFCKWKNNTCLADHPGFYSQHQRKLHPTQPIPITSHTGFKVPFVVSDCSGLGCQMWDS